MRRTGRWFLVAGAAVVVVVVVILALPRPPDAAVPAGNPAVSRDSSTSAPAIDRGARDRIEALPVAHRQRGEPGLRVAPRTPPAELGISTFTDAELRERTVDIFARVLDTSLDWTGDDFRARAARRGELSGAEAYAVYGYLRRCLAFFYPASGLPRDAMPGPDQAENCEGVPFGEALILEALDWLTLAAQRGYTQAEISYYRSARRLLMLERWLPYRHPERVHAFRDNAAEFLTRAVSSGHPDALAEYALALVERISFAEDAEMAYAYAQVALDLSAGSQPQAVRLVDQLEAALDAKRLAVAGDLADALCESYCR